VSVVGTSTVAGNEVLAVAANHVEGNGGRIHVWTATHL
jgi:hypothetical protein